MIDQTQLPYREAYACAADWQQVVDAIRRLVVRGAPAIGIAGAAALALRAAELCAPGAALPDAAAYRAELASAAQAIAAARPTAVNLAHEVGRALAAAEALLAQGGAPEEVPPALFRFTEELIADDERRCRRIGAVGADALEGRRRILTHCNAGSLACAFYGTALGVVYAAAERGGIERVYADETRPVGQGARLTAWELARAGVPVTLICDDMAASVMAQGLVDAVVVGADRIARNGDTANKIGTLGVAVLAQHFNIPFYVAAPLSTVDAACASGADIVIEQRSAAEVLDPGIAGVDILNPAFDVTPAALISAIITEAGAFAPAEVGSRCA